MLNHIEDYHQLQFDEVFVKSKYLYKKNEVILSLIKKIVLIRIVVASTFNII